MQFYLPFFLLLNQDISTQESNILGAFCDMNVSVYLFSFLDLWKFLLFCSYMSEFMSDQYLSSTGNKMKITPDKF